MVQVGGAVVPHRLQVIALQNIQHLQDVDPAGGGRWGGDHLEVAELTADRSVPTMIANLSGGSVSGLPDAGEGLCRFGEGSRSVEERQETLLWDSWPLLMMMVAVVSAEWVLRKRGGLP